MGNLLGTPTKANNAAAPAQPGKVMLGEKPTPPTPPQPIPPPADPRTPPKPELPETPAPPKTPSIIKNPAQPGLPTMPTQPAAPAIAKGGRRRRRRSKKRRRKKRHRKTTKRGNLKNVRKRLGNAILSYEKKEKAKGREPHPQRWWWQATTSQRKDFCIVFCLNHKKHPICKHHCGPVNVFGRHKTRKKN